MRKAQRIHCVGHLNHKGCTGSDLLLKPIEPEGTSPCHHTRCQDRITAISRKVNISVVKYYRKGSESCFA